VLAFALPTPTTPLSIHPLSLSLCLSHASLPPRSPVPHSHELSTTRAFSQADIAAFTRLTGDGNPIHHSRTPSLVPGLLTASLFPALVGTACPGAVYARQSLRFVGGGVRVGEAVRAVVRVERVRRRGGGGAGKEGSAVVTFRTTAVRVGGGREGEEGEVVVVEGEATAVVPGDGGGGGGV